MKEYITTFEEGLRTGLRPIKTLRTGVEFLTRALNVVPVEGGLRARTTFLNPYPDLEKQFPFPIIKRLSKKTLVFTPTALFLDREGQLEKIATYPYRSIPNIADYGDTVYIATPEGISALYGEVWVRDAFGPAKAQTCTDFRGQLVVGNITGFQGASGTPPGEVNPTEGTEVSGRDHVAWSIIGTEEFEFNLGREAGFAALEVGEVSVVKTLDKRVIVYGTHGCSTLSPEAEPTPTFGIAKYGNIGILNRNCVDGDERCHLFVGKDYNLYLSLPNKALSAEGVEPKKLGYSEYIRELVNPIVVYDEVERFWYIGDTIRCFVYTGVGLGESTDTPHGIIYSEDTPLAFFTSHGMHEIQIETSPINLNSVSMKTLNCVETSLSIREEEEGNQDGYSPEFRGSIDFRYAANQGFYIGRWIDMSPEGAFFPIVSAVEFKIKIWAPFSPDFAIDKLWLHWKQSDKRFTRGIVNAGRLEE